MSRQLVEIIGVLVLAVGVVASGIWIVEVEHRSRQLFIEAEHLSRAQDELQIEQGTYATHSRIETLARRRLELTVPRDDQLVVVVEPAH